MAKKIMICDDAAFMRMMIRDILVKGGYEIAGEVPDGKQAVELYSTCKPDLVLMDITMPVMDGLQALRQIRQKDPNACVVMCSAMGQGEQVQKAMKGGAKDFVVKPYQSQRVLQVIEKYLK